MGYEIPHFHAVFGVYGSFLSSFHALMQFGFLISSFLEVAIICIKPVFARACFFIRRNRSSPAEQHHNDPHDFFAFY